MAKIYSSAQQLIGHTPLLELCRLEKEFDLQARLLVKLEGFNPAGSVKDRAAQFMLDDAERQGKIRAGGTIIEPTSGNTGIGLAFLAAQRGYRTVLIMPSSMSVERRRLLKAYGAELVLVDGTMSDCIRKAEELHAQTPNSWIAGQFENPANARAHYETTGPEIFADTEGRVDVFVAGVGTGGTLTGTGTYLKEKNPNLKVVAVEPANSPVLSGGKAGKHGLMGIGAGFVPKLLNSELIDEIIAVTEQAAYETGAMLGKTEGVLVGISSGAALWAGLELAKRQENRNKTIVVLLPDTGDRYLSTPMFEI